MCGIVGIFGLINKTRVGMFEDMLAMSAVRGKDSTGVAVIGDNKVMVVKNTKLADKIIDSADYKTAKKNKLLCLLGHNRAATYGKIITENAHPFQHKHITMVHNGTLEGYWRLPNWWQYDTDSEALARCIAEHGIDTTWGVVEGAATLVWWDDNSKSLNVISNGKRPFFLQPLKGNDGVVWSSERWMLLTAALRADLEFNKPDKIYTPVVDKLYTFKWDSDLKVFVFEERILLPFKFGNTVPGYTAIDLRKNVTTLTTSVKKKKKSKKRKHGAGGADGVIKSAADSASVFQAWKEKQFSRRSDLYSKNDYSDEALRSKYPELFDMDLKELHGPDKDDLDTRAVPFRPSNNNTRTANRFKQLFDLVDLNAKYMTAEWFMTAYSKCCECNAPFNYNDFFTARVLKEGSAICDLCQMDAWVISGIEPNQIRLQ